MARLGLEMRRTYQEVFVFSVFFLFTEGFRNVPSSAPRCSQLEVGRVPRGVVEPPGAPGGRGEGSYEGRKSFEEKCVMKKMKKCKN